MCSSVGMGVDLRLFLPTIALCDATLRCRISLTQTHFHLGAPTGSGKTVAGELALFRLFREHPGKKAVYIAPLKVS